MFIFIIKLAFNPVNLYIVEPILPVNYRSGKYFIDTFTFRFQEHFRKFLTELLKDCWTFFKVF